MSLAVFGGMPGANAPGTNDFSCKPTAAHPRPVILVHGLLGNRSTNGQTYGPLLKNNGYCVFALTYGVEYDITPVDLVGGVDDMRVSARQLKRFVAKVLPSTGATKVDLVGHSEGTVMPQWYLRFLGGAAKVKNDVGLASAYRGTGIAGAGQPRRGHPGRRDPPHGLSVVPAVLAVLAVHEEAAPRRHAAAGRDLHQHRDKVRPAGAAVHQRHAAGVNQIVLQDVCRQDHSELFQIVSSRNAAQLVLNALDPEHPRPIRCSRVLPYVGELLPGLP